MTDNLEKEKKKGKKKETFVFDLTLENSDDDLPSAEELFNPTKKPKKEKDTKKKVKKERKKKRRMTSMVRPSTTSRFEPPPC